MEYSTSSEVYSIKDTPSKWKKDGDGYVYKKATYQHSQSGFEKSAHQNIEQLDALLEDLKNERQISREYDSTLNSSNFGTLKSSKPEKLYQKSENINFFKELQNTPKNEFNSEVTQTYSRQKVVERDEDRLKNLSDGAIISQQYSDTLKAPLSKSELHLDEKLTDNILPIPGTKVTTTVRTYTYEIPYNANTLTRSEQYVSSRNNNIKVYEPDSLTFKTESTSTLNRTNERPTVTYRTYEIQENNELNDVKTKHFHEEGNKINYYQQPVHTVENIVYNKSQKNRDYPETVDYRTNAFYNSQSSPNARPPTQNNYYYKEVSNSVHTYKDGRGPDVHPTNVYPANVLPSNVHPSNVQTSIVHQSNVHPPNELHPYPNTSNHTIINEYSSRTSTTNREGHYPQKISPFPIESTDLHPVNSPPQKVDELMQSFGNADVIDNSDLNRSHRKREVETAVATQHFVPSLNKAGKEVYYPPGHELTLTKREGRSAAYEEGGGRWAKQSGMYEYESGYKSKSKTKTGGAMVPVCLPLCCAMPCSIM